MPAPDRRRPPVRVVVDADGCEHERRLHFGDARTTAELASLVDGTGDTGLVIDGVHHPADRPLDQVAIAEGAVLQPGTATPPFARHAVALTGGLDAGRLVPVDRDVVMLGRGGGNDVVVESPTVSRRHARLELGPGPAVIHDLGSANGTWIDSRSIDTPTVVPDGRSARLGATTLTVRPPPPPPRQLEPGAARHPHHRPPRVLPPPADEAVAAPAREAVWAASATFSWAMFLAPLAIGLVLAVVFNPLLALFALLSPVVLVATWYEQRHRLGRRRRRASRRFRAELDAFAVALASRRAQATRRLRLLHPDPATLVERAVAGAPALWERRPHHPDFLELSVGTGDLPWAPPVTKPPGGELDDEVDAVVATASCLRNVPVTVDLRAAGAVGIVGGGEEQREAVARQLVLQAAVLHGPADLRVVEVSQPDRARPWTHWLPHLCAEDGTGPDGQGSDHDEAVTLVLADAEALRQAQGQRSGAISVVLASSVDDLPASCQVVIELVDDHGAGRVTWLSEHRAIEGVLLSGLRAHTAARLARSLARYSDPLCRAGTDLPTEVSLRQALGIVELDASVVGARWKDSSCRSLPAVLGVSADGVLEVDLVASGPHTLVAGTTGSGKSELLRSLVLSLAVARAPQDVTFLLIDYKGGSTFDALAALPHVVGVVTDLDEHLGARALRSLEAELRRREHALRAAGASDLDTYRAGDAPDREPIARLVIVIDEFATMVGELPGFVDALVGIAQRGRSLGMHLVLATQRPAGAVNDLIRANTSVRIALRVADRHESTDVIGSADAAGILPDRPGGAVLRIGTQPTIAFQAARAGRTPVAASAGPALTPIDGGLGLPSSTRGLDGEHGEDREGGDGGGEVGAVVSAVEAAHRRSGGAAPRRPWLAPLPSSLTLAELEASRLSRPHMDATDRHLRCLLGLADVPDEQRQHAISWDPAEGNLLVFGVPGSGATEALATVSLSLARRYGPDDCHLYVLERHGSLRPLDALAHCGAVVAAHEDARVRRLVRHLAARVRAPRSTVPEAPPVVLLIEDLTALLTDGDDLSRLRMLDELQHVICDGPSAGVHVVATASRASGLSARILASAPRRLVLRMADPYDYAALGLSARPRLCELPTGRGFDQDGIEVQLAVGDAADLHEVVRAETEGGSTSADPARRRPPAPIGELPADVDVASLLPAVRLDAAPWLLPVGIGDTHLAPCGLVLHEGDHALVAGPPRSGRSTALASLAVVAASADVRVVVFAPRRSALSDVSAATVIAIATEAELSDVLAEPDSAPTLVLVDDADTVDDADGVLADLITSPPGQLHVVAAGRADRLRHDYGRWTSLLRRSPSGLALRPDVDVDGDLWGIRLPRPADLGPAGRGLLVTDGTTEIVQVAHP